MSDSEEPLPNPATILHLKKIVSSSIGLDPDQIREEDILEDIGVDDLDLVEIIICIQDELDVKIPDFSIEAHGCEKMTFKNLLKLYRLSTMA